MEKQMKLCAHEKLSKIPSENSISEKFAENLRCRTQFNATTLFDSFLLLSDHPLNVNQVCVIQHIEMYLLGLAPTLCLVYPPIDAPYRKNIDDVSKIKPSAPSRTLSTKRDLPKIWSFPRRRNHLRNDSNSSQDLGRILYHWVEIVDDRRGHTCIPASIPRPTDNMTLLWDQGPDSSTMKPVGMRGVLGRDKIRVG